MVDSPILTIWSSVNVARDVCAIQGHKIVSQHQEYHIEQLCEKCGLTITQINLGDASIPRR